eukprot:XP_001693428.1 predicted protein [Chlamydomonas reinhardtii]
MEKAFAEDKAKMEKAVAEAKAKSDARRAKLEEEAIRTGNDLGAQQVLVLLTKVCTREEVM